MKLPPNGIIVGIKWVSKRIRDVQGLVERFRVRLVAKGFMQVFDLDYLKTYAPVKACNPSHGLCSRSAVTA